MTKETLKTFINKYYLGGTIESVKLVIDNASKTLKTNAITDDKNVLISVIKNNFEDLTDAEIGINDTSKFLKLLGVLGDDIVGQYNIHNGKMTSITLSDKNSDIQYVTADLSVIPAAPPLKKVPPFNVEILLDGDFVNRFIASKNALPDVDTFTLLMNKKGTLEFVLGYSSINTNRVKLNINTTVGKDTVAKTIHFNANHFKEILTANKDCNDAVLKVSDAGLASVEFICGEYTSNYYIVETKSVD
jgi:hypothetical protein